MFFSYLYFFRGCTTTLNITCHIEKITTIIKNKIDKYCTERRVKSNIVVKDSGPIISINIKSVYVRIMQTIGSKPKSL